MAAVVHKVTYKNHCTPQEYVTANSRWYLDSDVGAKLTGTAVMTVGLSRPTYSTGSLAAAAEVLLEDTGYEFYYVKNTSAIGTTGGILISMADEVNSTTGGTEFDDYRIFLGPGECFASKVRTFTSLQLKAVTSTHTYEYIKAT
jgi:hypothetical protein